MADRLGPSNRDLERYLEQGLTQQEIADKYHVAKGTIASLVHRAGLSSDRLKYRTTRLWSPIHDRHQAKHELNMLRSREKQLKGEELTKRVEGRLDSFLDRLDASNSVIAYAPATDDGFYVLDRNDVPNHLIDSKLPIVTERLTLDAIDGILRGVVAGTEKGNGIAGGAGAQGGQARKRAS